MMLDDFTKIYAEEYKQTLNQLDMKTIDILYNQLKTARDTDRSIYVIGNGGSAASASHWVCDFNKGTNTSNSKRMKMICLNDNIPIFSALGNDVSYEEVFVEQLKNLFEKDDLLIGLSVSGSSKNIIRALEYAQSCKGKTFSIIGSFKGEAKDYSDNTLIVPSKNYGIVEDVHMYICHLLSQFMFKENE